MIADDVALLAVIIGPVLVGFVIWVISLTFGFLSSSVRSVRNAWRRFRKKPPIGQRIEPVVR